MDESAERIEGSCFNPNITDDLAEDIKKIKGDAIGDTLYSERSVLKILIKLTQLVNESWNEEIETELCLLWDMSLEKDVVDFLIKHDFMKMSFEIIRTTSNVRLIEILVGIHGNISCVLRSSYPRDCLDEMILILYTSDDPQTLVQILRLLQAVSWDYADNHWLDSYKDINKLASHLGFLLSSSTNEELIISCLELLNTLCRQTDDKDYSHYFSTTEIIGGLVECWKQLLGNWSPEDDFPSKIFEKAITNWISILASFTAHQHGRACLCEYGEPVGDILFKLCTRNMLQPYDYIFMSSVPVLEAIIKIYFSAVVFIKILEVFYSVTQTQDSDESKDESDSESDTSILSECIASYCESVAVNIDNVSLQNILSRCNENHVLLFWKTVNERQPDPDSGQRAL